LSCGHFRLEHLGAAGDVATGANTGDQRIQAVRKVGQDLLRRGAHMGFDIGRVVELLRHPGVWNACGNLLGTGDGALHALFARRQVETGAVGQHQAATLDGHAVGHHQDQLVSLDRGHHGQPHAGIARGRLDDGAAGLQARRFSRCLDHEQGNTVLDRSARVAALGLDPDLVAIAKQAVDANVGRIANRLEGCCRLSS
jgi:hypothetical protein